MSRTKHDTKGPGYEYWASRWGRFGEEPGRFTKTKTHRKERRDVRDELRDNPDDARRWLSGGMNQR